MKFNIGDIVVPVSWEVAEQYGHGPYRVARVFDDGVPQVIVEQLDGSPVEYIPGHKPTAGSGVYSWKLDIFLNEVAKCK